MDCPRLDELSAWHDGESTAPEIDGHIAGCETCQATLDSFEQMDTALLGEPPPEAALARIHEGCLREIRKPEPAPAPVLTMQLITRLAAMFALVGIALFMREKLQSLPSDVTLDLGQPVEAAWVTHAPAERPPAPPPVPEIPAAVATPADLPPPVPEAPVDVADSAPAPAPRPRTPSAVSVDYDAITLVAAGTQAALAAHSRRGGSIAAPTQNEVAGVVHHVWLADDVVATLKALRDLMPQDNRKLLDTLVQDGADSYSLTLSATDRNLQALVNHMDSIGMVLVSPEAPQPQSANSLVFHDRPVRYHVDFVKK